MEHLVSGTYLGWEQAIGFLQAFRGMQKIVLWCCNSAGITGAYLSHCLLNAYLSWGPLFLFFFFLKGVGWIPRTTSERKIPGGGGERRACTSLWTASLASCASRPRRLNTRANSQREKEMYIWGSYGHKLICPSPPAQRWQAEGRCTSQTTNIWGVWLGATWNRIEISEQEQLWKQRADVCWCCVLSRGWYW